jgi:hypothetical protein
MALFKKLKKGKGHLVLIPHETKGSGPLKVKADLENKIKSKSSENILAKTG